MKETISLLAIWILLTFLVVLPAGAVPTGQTPTNASNTTYNPGAGSAAARGGNITNLDFMNSLSQTSKWQGYYGNVSGLIILGNATTGSMYNWTIASRIGNVYATQANPMNFTAWEDLGAKSGANIDSDFGFPATDNDSATNTFNTGSPPAINVSGKMITATNGAKTFDSTGAKAWWTIALARTSASADNYVFAGVINTQGDAFDGTKKDYQMIVPENAASGTVTYYFYVELV